MAWQKDLNPSEESSKESRINAAGLINSTLENLWNDSYRAMATGKYFTWNVKLDSIWAILGGDVVEGDENDKKMTALNMSIYKAGSLKTKTGGGFDKIENPNNPQQYHLLLKKSLFLRRLQNSQGKGTAYITEDDYDFD